MRTLLCLLLSSLFPFLLQSQAPVSNLYLFDLQRQGDTAFSVSQPQLLTYFNSQGYNNHPFFVAADEIYFSCQEPNEDQPDIRRISLRDTSTIKLTDTYEGEYSPRRPSFMTTGFYTVRMEFSGSDTLIRLWQITGSGYGGQGSRPVFKDLVNVGYYEWIRPALLAIHLNGSPNTLALAIPDTDQITPVAAQVGRCFKFATATNQLIYLQKKTGSASMLMSLDMKSFNPKNKPTPQALIPPLSGREDFALLNDGTLLMAMGSKLFKYKPGMDTGWTLVADLATYQLTQITRLEVNRENTKLILVN